MIAPERLDPLARACAADAPGTALDRWRALCVTGLLGRLLANGRDVTVIVGISCRASGGAELSYCRWSTDDFACDIYAYEDCCGGWTIHVAGNRHVGECPKVDWSAYLGDEPLSTAQAEALAGQMNAQHAWLGECERASIELPHAGATFHEPTLDALRARLLELRGLGYRFPDDVLSAVDEEIAEERR